MPCGGVYPMEFDESRCWACSKGDCELYVMEWDCALHKKCLGKFLMSDEGQLVIRHGHDIIQGEE